MAGGFEIVMDNRRKLVQKMIDLMEQGHLPTKSLWNKDALAPQNPFSGVYYRGGNRIRLLTEVMEKGYRDPRWGTFLQYREKGYFPKKGEKATLCEKWIFEKETMTKDADGTVRHTTETLERPIVSYFLVFNGEQIKDFPIYEETKEKEKNRMQLIDQLKETSECPIKECAQPDAFYRPSQDCIYLPLPGIFKDEESHAATLLHEMSHSTGHPKRLNRDLTHRFGTPEYAKEELRAELGALFTEVDLGIHLRGEHYQDHSQYLRSWISVLEKDYHEFFRACADAEKISGRLLENYERRYPLERSIREVETRKIPAKEKIQKKILNR